jgi:chlorobactene glucosyltransferase
MIEYLTNDLIIHLIFFESIILLIIIWNLFLANRLRKFQLPEDPPFVSILVPARNEQDNIKACVQSLLQQDYQDYEVLVLDDQSTDQTRPILDGISSTDPRLKVFTGQLNPDGSIGKNWACTQLAQESRGKILFFTDADTIHHPQTLATVVAAMEGEPTDLLTGYPRQLVLSWGERFLVPFFSWVVTSFFPLGLAYKIPYPIFTNAVGQLIAIKREAYLSIGGHRGVRESIVDDLALARAIHLAGFRWRVIHIADLVSCRMYQNSREALEGFSKNLFAAFEFRLLPYLFSFTWLVLMFLEPLIVALLLAIGKIDLTAPWTLAAWLILSLLIWIIPYISLKMPIWLAFMFPVTVLSISYTAIRSLWLSLTGKLSWKGRSIRPSKWKWI